MEYDLSSHRGVDRPFNTGKVSKMYVFAKPDASQRTPREFQLCCRHELHVQIPPSGVIEDSPYELNDFVEGNAMQRVVEGIVPDGVRVELPARVVLDPSETGYDFPMAVYLIVYCGQHKPITRVEADGYRAIAEEAVSNHLPLRQNRVGRMVSRPFPYPLLQGLIKGRPT